MMAVGSAVSKSTLEALKSDILDNDRSETGGGGGVERRDMGIGEDEEHGSDGAQKTRALML